ncbi:MAG: glycosyltransferase family 4 protein [Flavobacteriales bacterium]|nr:glycosyltransferase family 4 protein [Flavobacteriales bacterium]
MRLLILTDGIQPFVIGGMQKHSFSLAQQLALLGHQVTLVHCVASSAKVPDQEELLHVFGAEAMKNMEVIGMKFPAPAWYPGHYLKESYIYSRQIYDKLKDRLNEFDFIYAKGFTAWYFMEQKSKGKKLPKIGLKFHGYEMFQKPANFKMRIHNWMLSGPTKWNNYHADYIFSYGGKITQLLRDLQIVRDAIIEIPTGIDQTWIADRLPERVNRDFVFIGRYERRKGIEEINAAISHLAGQTKFHFHFIGPIPPSAKIKSDQVTYHGSISDKNEIKKILDRCGVLVTPSHSEGMPNVIMEGMARGLAVLGTDVGAVASVVTSENGWFVLPGDIKSLEEQILHISKMDDASLRTKQEASLRQIREFTWEKIGALTALRISQRIQPNS